MAVTMMRQDFTPDYEESLEPCSVRELDRADQDEVIEFLSARPIHTVFMAGLIRDNGSTQSAKPGLVLRVAQSNSDNWKVSP